MGVPVPKLELEHDQHYYATSGKVSVTGACSDQL
jgi:hypothetical protein